MSRRGVICREETHVLLHGALNASLVVLSGVNLLLRRGRRVPSGPFSPALNVVANAGLVFSAWLGGELVYRYGMRVEGVSPVRDAAEIKLPDDAQIADAFHRLDQTATGEDA